MSLFHFPNNTALRLVTFDWLYYNSLWSALSYQKKSNHKMLDLSAQTTFEHIMTNLVQVAFVDSINLKYWLQRHIRISFTSETIVWNRLSAQFYLNGFLCITIITSNFSETQQKILSFLVDWGTEKIRLMNHFDQDLVWMLLLTTVRDPRIHRA